MRVPMVVAFAIFLLVAAAVRSGHAQTSVPTQQDESDIVALIARPLAVRSPHWRCTAEQRIQCGGGTCEPGSSQVTCYPFVTRSKF